MAEPSGRCQAVGEEERPLSGGEILVTTCWNIKTRFLVVSEEAQQGGDLCVVSLCTFTGLTGT